MPDTIEVSPKAANDALQAGGAVLIDVRERSEYDQVHIPGSILIPLAELPARMSEIPADQDVYVHCRMGGRSARAAELMRAFGRSNSYNVSGGIEAWEDEGLPVEH
jgi:rhodanese-related sulfurtransferase